MARDTRVAPPVLEAGVRESRRIRDEIGRPASPSGPPTGGVMRDVVPTTQHAADGLRKWLTERALRDLLQSQGDDLSRLSRRMEAIARALESSAAAYQRNEDANSALFREAEGRF